jgi:hypothetical protein
MDSDAAIRISNPFRVVQTPPAVWLPLSGLMAAAILLSPFVAVHEYLLRAHGPAVRVVPFFVTVERAVEVMSLLTFLPAVAFFLREAREASRAASLTAVAILVAHVALIAMLFAGVSLTRPSASLAWLFPETHVATARAPTGGRTAHVMRAQPRAGLTLSTCTVYVQPPGAMWMVPSPQPGMQFACSPHPRLAWSADGMRIDVLEP